MNNLCRTPNWNQGYRVQNHCFRGTQKGREDTMTMIIQILLWWFGVSMFAALWYALWALYMKKNHSVSPPDTQ